MAHRMSGGIACVLRGDQLIEARGGEETVLLHTGELPGSFGGAAAHLVANALAAAAACRALGVSVKDIRRGFATFTPAQANPGRGNVYQVGGVPLVVDYGHNPAALATMGRLLHEAWGGQPLAAITLPGDRRDDLIEESAATVARWFSRVVVYEDRDLRGREPGEMTRLISGALARHRPGHPRAARRRAGGRAPAAPWRWPHRPIRCCSPTRSWARCGTCWTGWAPLPGRAARPGQESDRGPGPTWRGQADPA